MKKRKSKNQILIAESPDYAKYTRDQKVNIVNAWQQQCHTKALANGKTKLEQKKPELNAIQLFYNSITQKNCSGKINAYNVACCNRKQRATVTEQKKMQIKKKRLEKVQLVGKIDKRQKLNNKLPARTFS